jgi:hypothetical protein
LIPLSELYAKEKNFASLNHGPMTIHHIDWYAARAIVFALAKAEQTSAYPTRPGVTLPSSTLLRNSATERPTVDEISEVVGGLR